MIWEVKDTGNGIHSIYRNFYWSANGSIAPDGTLFTVFLDTLNNKCPADETTACTKNADCAGADTGCATVTSLTLVRPIGATRNYGQKSATGGATPINGQRGNSSLTGRELRAQLRTQQGRNNELREAQVHRTNPVQSRV